MDDEKDNLVDFCLLDVKPEYRLSKFEHLTLVGGQELEKAITWLAKRLSMFRYDDRLGNFDIELLKRGANYYHNDFRSTSLEGYYVRPKKPPLVEKRAIHGTGDGYIYDLSFQSEYQPQHPDYKEEFFSYTENRTVYARYWQHVDKKKAPVTMIALHGWTMGDQRINSLAFQPGLFYKKGMDVILVELPFHGRRMKASDKDSSLSLFPSSHFLRTNEAVFQMISDLRQLVLYLKENGVENIGVIGMSLGAYIACLWASLDTPAFCIPLVPMISMADLAWEILEESPEFEDFQERGLTRELLEAVYGIHCPLNFSPNLEPNDILIIAGIGDRIVPPRQPKSLWSHWGQPRMHWYKGGHFAQFKKTRAFQEIMEFLLSHGFASS